MSSDQPQCPDCSGKGFSDAHVMGRLANGKGFSESRRYACQLCNGTGVVTPEVTERYCLGRLMAEDRKSRKVGLRDEAKRLGITAKELSDREWGRA